MVSGFCPQLTSLFQLQRLANYITHNEQSSMPVLHCLLSLIQPTSLCSLKLSCNSVPSRNMTGLTRLDYSKDFLVTLCSLHFRVKVKVLVAQSCPDSLWLHGNVAHQVPLSMEFSRLEYWSGLPFLSPRDLLNPGVKPGSPALQVDSSLSEPPGKTTPELTWKFAVATLLKVVCGVSFGIITLCFSIHFQHKIVHMFHWKTF